MIRKNVSLKEFNSWRIPATAKHFAEPRGKQELQEVYHWALGQKLPIFILGSGTNVLVPDTEFPGLVIFMGKLSGLTEKIRSFDETQYLEIRSLAGTSKMELLKVFLRHSLTPAVFLAGIPGTVGGGVAMNAGVGEQILPREFCEIVSSIEVLDHHGNFHTIPSHQLSWRYRHCDGWQPNIITEVLLHWPMRPDNTVQQRVRLANQKRLQTQPLNQPNSGSVFKNPPQAKAAKLIEDCGLKGHCIGGAQVSNKHANFIVNLGEATSKDVASLIDFVQKKVADQTGIILTTEVVMLKPD